MSDVPEVLDAPAEVVHIQGTEPAEAMLWRHFGKLGRMLASSAFVPASFRTARDEDGRPAVNPQEVMAAIAYGYEIGLGPMQSLQSFDVIQGKPTLKPETMRAMIRAHGHSLVRVEATDERVTFHGKRRDTGDEESVTYTIEDASRLGLTGKDNWKKQPRAMLTARATGEIARSLFSDVIAGASYTPEELGDDGAPTEYVDEVGVGATGTTANSPDLHQDAPPEQAADPVAPPEWAVDGQATLDELDPERPFVTVPTGGAL